MVLDQKVLRSRTVVQWLLRVGNLGFNFSDPNVGAHIEAVEKLTGLTATFTMSGYPSGLIFCSSSGIMLFEAHSDSPMEHKLERWIVSNDDLLGDTLFQKFVDDVYTKHLYATQTHETDSLIVGIMNSIKATYPDSVLRLDRGYLSRGVYNFNAMFTTRCHPRYLQVLRGRGHQLDVDVSNTYANFSIRKASGDVIVFSEWEPTLVSDIIAQIRDYFTNITGNTAGSSYINVYSGTTVNILLDSSGKFMYPAHRSDRHQLVESVFANTWEDDYLRGVLLALLEGEISAIHEHVVGKDFDNYYLRNHALQHIPMLYSRLVDIEGAYIGHILTDYENRSDIARLCGEIAYAHANRIVEYSDGSSIYRMSEYEHLSIQHTTCSHCGVITGAYLDVDASRDVLFDNSRRGMCHACEGNQRYAGLNMKRIDVASSRSGTFQLFVPTDVPVDVSKITYESSLLREVRDYDFKPNRFSFLYTQRDADGLQDGDRLLFLGTEIELDNGGRDNEKAEIIMSTLTAGQPFAYAMRDGSLNDGFEIGVMPATLDYHMNGLHYKQAFQKATQLDYRAHDTETCGLHVHINRAFLGNTKLEQNYHSALIALIIERNWDDIVNFARRDYSRIQNWANKKDLTDDVHSRDDMKSLGDKMYKKYGQDKYVAVNMTHGQSIELRIFRGTLKPITYLATLQFVSNLARYVKTCTLAQAQHTTLQDIFNVQHYHELATYATERGLA